MPEKPKVKLVGINGNAFCIMGAVTRALKKAGASKDQIDKYREEAMGGSYENLLNVTAQYVDIE